MHERWVVISNCQSFGLAASINALARDVTCIACDHFEFRRLVAQDPDHFGGYDLAVVAPELAHWAEGRDFTLPRAVTVPGFRFEAYHPDCVYVLADGESLQGPIGAYHSLIALASYKEGIDPARVPALFNPALFAAAGYLDHWRVSRDQIAGLFRSYDLDISATFVRRSRGRCFMHTVDHPKIEILFDIAQALLTKLSRPTYADAVPPSDALSGTSWPVYPEIGAQLGVSGNYLFHAPDEAKPLELGAFLDKSRALYSGWDRSLLRVTRHVQPRLLRLREIIRTAA